jgi:predicted nucleic-acid-binding protein
MVKVESLDTNAVLRLLLGDVPHQYQAVMALLCSGDARYHIDDLAVAETVYILENLYELDRNAISTLLDALFKEPAITCNKKVLLKAIAFWTEHPKLSFYDTYLVWNAELAERTPLWTFDKKLANQGDAARLIAT